MDKESLICSSLEGIAIPALVSMLEFLFVQELTPKDHKSQHKIF